MSEMRSQRSASFMKWVDRKIVTPSSRERSISVRQNASRAIGIDARGRLVENENGRLVQHRDRELQPLLDAERQALGLGVGDVLQVVALRAAPRSDLRSLSARQVVKLRVQLEILPHREFAVERKGLRHVADVATRLHVVRAHRLAEQLARAVRSPAEVRSAFSSSSICRSRSSRGSRRFRRGAMRKLT